MIIMEQRSGSNSSVILLLSVAIGLCLQFIGWVLWRAPLPATGLYLFYGLMLLLALCAGFNLWLAWRLYAALPSRAKAVQYLQCCSRHCLP